MRHAIPQRSMCLLGLVASIALLGIGQVVLLPAAELALETRSGEDAAATDRDWIAPVVPFRLPPRRGDEGVSRVRREHAIRRPLADLSLLTAPTAAGASLVAERVTYTPGATVSVRRHTQIRVVSLEVGTLDARIDGVAFLDRRWPAGSLLASEPHRIEGVVHLYPGDLLAVPAEAAFTAHNPGEVLAVSLEVSVRLPVPLTPMTDRISAVPGSGDVRSERLAAPILMAPGISAVFSMERVILPPDERMSADTTAGPVLFIVERGLLGVTRGGLEVERASGEAELVLQGALAAIHNTDEAPLALLLLTITPIESDAAAA